MVDVLVFTKASHQDDTHSQSLASGLLQTLLADLNLMNYITATYCVYCALHCKCLTHSMPRQLSIEKEQKKI